MKSPEIRKLDSESNLPELIRQTEDRIEILSKFLNGECSLSEFAHDEGRADAEIEKDQLSSALIELIDSAELLPTKQIERPSENENLVEAIKRTKNEILIHEKTDPSFAETLRSTLKELQERQNKD